MAVDTMPPAANTTPAFLPPQDYLMQDDMGCVVMALHRIPAGAIPPAKELLARAVRFKVTNRYVATTSLPVRTPSAAGSLVRLAGPPRRQLRFLKSQYVAATCNVGIDSD